MKRLYLGLWTLCLVAITILYFQLLTGVVIQVPFFTEWINVSIYNVYLILLSGLSGVFFTLGISNFNSSSWLDDDFDL